MRKKVAGTAHSSRASRTTSVTPGVGPLSNVNVTRVIPERS
jgi:hypothetical protein